jgi:CelD/BcsL family acetyltransferase involved in cellulose biosynthesis
MTFVNAKRRSGVYKQMQKVSQKSISNQNDSPREQSFDLQILEGAKRILEFGQDWDDLFARTVDAPPYLSRPWISTFIQEGKITGNPLFVLAFCRSKLVALLPLAVRKFLNAKIAVPIGTGEASYHGMLLDPKYPSVIECIAHLIISQKVFDVYINTFLSTIDTTTNNLLAMLQQKGCFCRQTLKDPCHYIQLGRSFDEYFSKCMSSRTRHTLRRKERRLFHNSDVKVDYYSGMQVTDEIMRRLAAVQEESWMKRRGVAILGQPFYQKFLLTMAQAGLGCLWLMTINGDDAAFQYAFIANNKLYFRFTAFKLKYESHSVGQSLMMRTIRDACDDDVLAIDLGPGEAEYKQFWSTDHYDINRAITASRLRGKSIANCYYIVWRLGEIKYLHSAYRRLKRILRCYKHMQVKLQSGFLFKNT